MTKKEKIVLNTIIWLVVLLISIWLMVKNSLITDFYREVTDSGISVNIRIDILFYILISFSLVMETVSFVLSFIPYFADKRFYAISTNFLLCALSLLMLLIFGFNWDSTDTISVVMFIFSFQLSLALLFANILTFVLCVNNVNKVCDRVDNIIEIESKPIKQQDLTDMEKQILKEIEEAKTQLRIKELKEELDEIKKKL